MAVIGTLDKKDSNSSHYVVGIQSAALDAADEETNVLNTSGYKEHEAQFTPNSVTDTNTATVQLLVSKNEGTSFFVADSKVCNLATDGVPQTLSYTGFADQIKVKVSAIGGGSPTVDDLALVSSQNL